MAGELIEYSPSKCFEKEAFITHKEFGVGIVESSRDGAITVFFIAITKRIRLAHNRDESNISIIKKDNDNEKLGHPSKDFVSMDVLINRHDMHGVKINATVTTSTANEIELKKYVNSFYNAMKMASQIVQLEKSSNIKESKVFTIAKKIFAAGYPGYDESALTLAIKIIKQKYGKEGLVE